MSTVPEPVKKAPSAAGSSSKKRKKKKTNPVKKTFAVIGTTLLSLFLIAVITGSIVATALTVYVMRFMNMNETDIDLANLEMATSSFIYAYDQNNEPVEIQKVSSGADRVVVKLEQVPEFVRNAFICTEDERFYDHDGVDFKRTFAAFANFFLHFWDSNQGGSTITQQLVKNVTGDDRNDPARKIREIFRAMNLERYATKDDILEAYLNYIGFGGPTSGVEAASTKYFGKHVWEISLAQAASLAAIPKSPETLNPWADPVGNKDRQETVLGLMLKNGAITDQEYEEAIAADLEIVDRNAPSAGDSASNSNSKVQSYFVDMVMFDVANDLKDLYGLKDQQEGLNLLRQGGYKIYATVDLQMQSAVEQKFLDPATFASKVLNDPPQSAFIAMDYNGNIKAVVGGIGEKPAPLCLNRATMSKRSIGSCVKPISTYGYGMSIDLFHWSTVWQDSPIEVKDEHGNLMQWPKNYSNRWSYQNYFTFDALQRSLNTIPAQLCQMETPSAVWDFMKNKMQITSLVDADKNFSPMTVGGLTEGISLKELVSSYQAFGNLGKIYKPTSYSKVTDAEGNIVLEHKYEYTQALDADSAYVMNKLLQQVVDNSTVGTGRAAKLPGTALVGKTGTSQDWIDLSFVGCTPNYVSGVWYGYDDQYVNGQVHSTQNTYYGSAQVWKNIFGEIATAAPHKEFPANGNVREMSYCTITGKLAGQSCPSAVGYYKPSNVPNICFGDHSVANPNPAPNGSTAQTTAPVTADPGAQTTAPATAPVETTAPVDTTLPETTTPEVTTTPAPPIFDNP